MCAGGRVTHMGLASHPVGACFHLSVVPPIRAGQYSPSIQFLSTSGVHRECRATLTLHVMAGSPQQGMSDRVRGSEFAVENAPYAVPSGGRDMSQPGPLQQLALTGRMEGHSAFCKVRAAAEMQSTRGTCSASGWKGSWTLVSLIAREGSHQTGGTSMTAVHSAGPGVPVCDLRHQVHHALSGENLVLLRFCAVPSPWRLRAQRTHGGVTVCAGAPRVAVRGQASAAHC